MRTVNDYSGVSEHGARGREREREGERERERERERESNACNSAFPSVQSTLPITIVESIVPVNKSASLDR